MYNMQMRQPPPGLFSNGVLPLTYQQVQGLRQPPNMPLPGPVITTDGGKTIIVSMDGQVARKRLNAMWIILGAFLAFCIIYICYAALADLPPFFQRGPGGGKALPKPLERPVAPPATTSIATSLAAPKVAVIGKGSESSTAQVRKSVKYGVVKMDSVSKNISGDPIWSSARAFSAGDQVRISVEPSSDKMFAIVKEENGEMDVIDVFESSSRQKTTQTLIVTV
jgi:hypothetical protein